MYEHYMYILISCMPFVYLIMGLISFLFQVVYSDVYMLDDEMKWKVLPPMPKPNSHIECAWVIVNNSIIITGGTTEKNPVTKRMILVGEVFKFDLDSLVIIFPCYYEFPSMQYLIFLFIYLWCACILFKCLLGQ
jgi:hypothetical protein